ncbi:MAG: tripartite tricarboxylate transporter permease [Alphaproteobacteria bacterium]|nr:MAG: tripartite tricarboxylate transporter permease [Alphaproteobacteria bacterium]
MAVSAGKAFLTLMEPHRLMFLALGCIMGLVLGIIPGIGGLTGTAMLLPFTFNMDPYSAFALLLGLGATTATGDPIPAVLFGVPGGAASAATVLDGFPMAKKGEAGRALSAAYMSSLMGGVFGAVLMGISIPILRPVMLFIGSPELLAFSVLGISMVAVLSGNAPLRGITAGCLGVMIAMIGTDPQTGTLRWTFDSLYLWDGLPLTPLLLGVFALPELCDLLIGRVAIASDTGMANIYKGQWQGVKDCFSHWWLIMRCSWIGGGIGSIPGISASVVDWLAYGHALKTEKGASATFGKGDVRGVIASESSNNAKEGGALVPTVAFGVPGSATMAILLGAFLIHGLVPGPDMLTKNLSITYAMVWSVALANILGAGLCYAFSPQFAKLATLRYTLILPAVLGIIYIGAFEATRQWGDLFTLLFFGLVGWIMKQFKWPRPPLILGVVLGDTIERYLFISIERYGLSWMLRPIVVLLFALAILGLIRPLLQDIRSQGGLGRMLTSFQRPTFHPSQLFTMFMIALIGAAVVASLQWDFSAKIVPLVVGTVALCAAVLSLFNEMCRKPAAAAAEGPAEHAEHEVGEKIHMDLVSDTAHLPVREIVMRGGLFFGYLIGFMAVMATIGLIPTVGLFVVFFMRHEAKERWSLVIPYAVVLVLFIWFAFDYFMAVPWPPTLIGQWFPLLKAIPSV